MSRESLQRISQSKHRPAASRKEKQQFRAHLYDSYRYIYIQTSKLYNKCMYAVCIYTDSCSADMKKKMNYQARKSMQRSPNFRTSI